MGVPPFEAQEPGEGLDRIVLRGPFRSLTNNLGIQIDRTGSAEERFEVCLRTNLRVPQDLYLPLFRSSIERLV